KGLSYDRIKGELSATEGVYLTKEPITITGPSSNLELDGRLDMVRDRIDAKVLVTLPVSNNLPLAALIAGAPAIGGALFVSDTLLGDRVARVGSVHYKFDGPCRSPEMIFYKPVEKPEYAAIEAFRWYFRAQSSAPLSVLNHVHIRDPDGLDGRWTEQPEACP